MVLLGRFLYHRNLNVLQTASLSKALIVRSLMRGAQQPLECFRKAQYLNQGSSPNFASNIKGATKFYFMHYSCVVIILFNTDLFMSVLPTYSLKNLVFVFLCSMHCVCSALNTISCLQTYNICLINVYVTKCSVIFFSLCINYL